MQNKLIQLLLNLGLAIITIRWKLNPNNSRVMTVDPFTSVGLRKKRFLHKVKFGRLLKFKETMNPCTCLK